MRGVTWRLEQITERVLARCGLRTLRRVVLREQLAPGKTLGRGAGTKIRTHPYARKYAKSTGALKHAARNRYTAGKISGKVCCTQSAATYNPPPNNPAKDR